MPGTTWEFKKTTKLTKMLKTTDLICIFKIILLESFQGLCEKLFSRCVIWYDLLVTII